MVSLAERREHRTDLLPNLGTQVDVLKRVHYVTELDHIAIGLGLGPVAFDNFEDLSRVCMGHNRSARLLSLRNNGTAAITKMATVNFRFMKAILVMPTCFDWPILPQVADNNRPHRHSQ